MMKTLPKSYTNIWNACQEWLNLQARIEALLKSWHASEKGAYGNEKDKIDKQNIGDVPKTLAVSLSQIFPRYDNSTAS